MTGTSYYQEISRHVTKKASYQDVNRQAAEWLAKVDAGSMTLSEKAAFDCWLAADMRHLGAYAKAEAVLSQLERVGAAGADWLRLSEPPPQLITRRRIVLTGGIAAGVAMATLGVEFTRRYLGKETYTTRIGETKIIPLVDGSVITLNTSSEVAVDYTRARREVHLLYGETLFDVAKNKSRPFIVVAGDTHIRAVGTSFTVKFLPNQPLQVLVQEGTVEVRRPDIPQASPVRVSINSRAVAPQNAPIETQAIEPARIKRDLAWRTGRISFDNVTLKMAAEEFARYSEIQIEVDPAIANQSITGLFVSNDPIGFARAAATSLNLHAEIGKRVVRIAP
jgi:transmembrane sensor